MPIGSPQFTIQSLDALDNQNLESELKNCKEELFKLRFQKATGQLETHGRLKAVRRDIARIETVLQERRLKVRTAPQAVTSDDSKTASKKSKSKTDKKVADKKPATKKPAAKETTVKKTAAKKPVAKKTVAKKPAAKKAPVKKGTAKKAAPKKATITKESK
jgi:large subunit ribosomal protein L29